MMVIHLSFYNFLPLEWNPGVNHSLPCYSFSSHLLCVVIKAFPLSDGAVSNHCDQQKSCKWALLLWLPQPLMLRCDSFWSHHPTGSDGDKYLAMNMCDLSNVRCCVWVGCDCEVTTMRSGCCVIKSMLIATAVAVVTEDWSRDPRQSREDGDIEEPRWRVQVCSSVPHGTSALYPSNLYWTYVAESINSKQEFGKNEHHQPLEDRNNPGGGWTQQLYYTSKK